jgi:oxygen-independent coproporphyrinogen-3 oxidase
MMMTHSDTRRGLSTSGILRELSELRRLMGRPQRHRLLHGYPLAAAMPRVVGKPRSAQDLLSYDPSRGLLVGVLPHPFCNPAVAGCGFGTFPHEVFNARGAAVVIDRVVRELEGKLRADPGLAGRPVAVLYFGGGTANLSPPEPFRKLCRALAGAFNLSSAEVTLEGVPAAFLNRKPLLVDLRGVELPARPVRHARAWSLGYLLRGVRADGAQGHVTCKPVHEARDIPSPRSADVSRRGS